MRIAHLVESSEGSARAALVLARSMVQAGHDVTFIYAPERADPRFEEGLKEADAKMDVATLPPGRTVASGDFLSMVAVWRLLQETGPYDVLHAHGFKAGVVGRLVGALCPRVRVVYTPYAFVTLSPEGLARYKRLEKFLSFLTSAIIAVSTAEKDHAVRVIGIAERKVVVVPGGLPMEERSMREHARERLGWTGEELVVGFVGRLSPQKNPLRLIDAFSAVAYVFSSLRLVIVGDGPLLEETKKRAVEKEIGGRILFLENGQAQQLVPGFDVLCCSSDYEGLPLVFIEALQAGVPIVTTPVGGAEECVLPGKTGFIAKDFEMESLSEALRLFIRLDPATRQTMIGNAQRRGKIFSMERMAGALLELYRSIR